MVYKPQTKQKQNSNLPLLHQCNLSARQDPTNTTRKGTEQNMTNIPVSILYKSIAARYRPVRVADGPITTRCRFIKNASWYPAGSSHRATRRTANTRTIALVKTIVDRWGRVNPFTPSGLFYVIL